MSCSKATLSWPSTYVGSIEAYSLDCTDYVRSSGQTVMSVDWTVPNGLSEVSSSNTDNFATVNLEAIVHGKFTVGYAVNSDGPLGPQLVLGKVSLPVEVL